VRSDWTRQTDRNSSAHIEVTNEDKMEVSNNSTGLILLGGLKYLKLGHWYPRLVLSRLRLLFRN
jgi:hypothetical protein